MNSRGAARPRSGEPINLIFTKSGQTRYRTVLDYAAQGQPRKQRRQTFQTLTEARAHVAEIKSRRRSGTLPNGDKKTFSRFVEEYILERKGRVRPITLRTYKSALNPYVEALGDLPVGQISIADVESVVRKQEIAGRSKRTISLGLMQTRCVFSRAIREGVIIRNVAAGVTSLGNPSRPRSALSLEEFQKVSQTAKHDHLASAWSLLLHGLRRSEILGLQWQDLDLNSDPATLTIRRGRTEGNIETTPPKTRQGYRSLPLTQELKVVLRGWRSHVLNEFGMAAISPDRFIFVNDRGVPVRPEWMSDEWKRLCVKAGVTRNVVLHEARHTSVTIMRSSGVPDRIVAAWHGHDESTMRSVYDHAHQDHEGLLSAASTLSALQSRLA